MRGNKQAVMVGLVGLLGVLVGAALVWFGVNRNLAKSKPIISGLPRRGVLSRSQSEDAIIAAVAKVGPAVVNIDSLFQAPQESRLERMLRGQMGIPQPFPKEGQGSGTIIDGKRGYILTNAHVVRGATQVKVTLADGRRLDAKVKGVDPLSEVAVLQIKGGDLPTAGIGSVEKLPIGSWVIAIGNPFGLENTVTVGVISAKDRQIASPKRMLLQNLVQTDAAINPGNSGGALVDLEGNLVGIPTAMIPYAQGIGFAVSIDVAKKIAERLIATGKMPWLGIGHRDLTEAEKKKLGAPNGRGSLVVKVFPNGPAAKAGMEPGDVIISLGGRKIANVKDLGAAIHSYDSGTRISVSIWREKREQKLTVMLGEVPSDISGPAGP